MENNVHNNGKLSPTIEIEPSKTDKSYSIVTQQEIVLTDYITKSLDIVASQEGFRNYQLLVDHGSSIGDGFVGVILKVQIKEINSEKSLTVLAKVLPDNKARREMPLTLDTFEREVYAYNNILPEFVAFQREKKISRSHGFFNFPKCYYAHFDKEAKDAIIVMEDLKLSGHRMWNKFKPIDFDHSRLLMIALGRFHALSFAMKAKSPEKFKKFQELSDIYGETMNEESTKAFVSGSLAQASMTLDPNDKKSLQKFQKMIENIEEIMSNKSYKSEPSVLNHGDCWMNNMLYYYTKRGSPEDIVLIDWQMTGCRSPVQDLVYFIFICTDKQLRSKHYDELLNIYHRSLKELLDNLGGNTAVQFPFTSMLRQLRQFGKFGVMSACFIVPWLQTKNEDLPDQDEMAEKMQEADQEALDEMMKQYMSINKEGADKINQRVRDIIHDGIRLGYL